MATFDTLILNGTIVDGTGKPGYRGDVGIRGKRIEAVGELGKAEARERIDAKGHVVAPGFIDIHTHSDVTVLDDPGAESMVYQGVTTQVVGNCSYSAFPCGVATPQALKEIMGTTMSSVVEWDWRTMDEWANRIDSNGVSINVAALVGNAALRVGVGALMDRPATAEELKGQQRLAIECVEQGAFGMSTGLTLMPSMYADVAEVAAVCKAIQPYGAIYATHARVLPGLLVKMIEEAAEVGRRSGIGVQFSHLAINDFRFFGTGQRMIDVFDRSRAEGIDITYDMYPYTAAGIDLHQTAPIWLKEGGLHPLLVRLADKKARKKAIDEMNSGLDGGPVTDWKTVVITMTATEKNRWTVGKSIEQVSQQTGEAPSEAVLRLLGEEKDEISATWHNRNEIDMRYFMSQTMGMIGSDGNAVSPDGLYGKSMPHPRFYGTYPRILGRYVREVPVLTLETAVRKMSGFPADRMGIKDRGYIEKGKAADIVVFNPDTVLDRATFEAPHQYPVGMPHVFVNGKAVIKGGKHTGARSGRVLRRGGEGRIVNWG